jgi:multiple sugar transport system permease protein
VSAATAAGAGRPRSRRRPLGRHPLGLAFVTPYVIFLAAIFAYPLGFSVYMSLHDYFFAAPGAIVDRPWVGLKNFSTVLNDPDVRAAFLHVGIFIVINVPLTVIIALGLAVGLNAAIPFRGFLRAAYYIPYVAASVAVIAVWLWLFSRQGLVNTVLGPLAPDPSWLVNNVLAMPMIAVFVAWKQAGFFILLYLAALQNVPKELYDAAAIDGAGAFRRFRYITLPLMRPLIGIQLLFGVIYSAYQFAIPYVMLGSNPGGDADLMMTLIVRQSFSNNLFGFGAAASTLLMLGMLVWVAVWYRAFRRDLEVAA